MGCDGRARGIFPLRNGSSGKGVRATSREGMFHKVQKKVNTAICWLLRWPEQMPNRHSGRRTTVIYTTQQA